MLKLEKTCTQQGMVFKLIKVVRYKTKKQVLVFPGKVESGQAGAAGIGEQTEVNCNSALVKCTSQKATSSTLSSLNSYSPKQNSRRPESFSSSFCMEQRFVHDGRLWFKQISPFQRKNAHSARKKEYLVPKESENQQTHPLLNRRSRSPREHRYFKKVPIPTATRRPVSRKKGNLEGQMPATNKTATSDVYAIDICSSAFTICPNIPRPVLRRKESKRWNLSDPSFYSISNTKMIASSFDDVLKGPRSKKDAFPRMPQRAR